MEMVILGSSGKEDQLLKLVGWLQVCAFYVLKTQPTKCQATVPYIYMYVLIQFVCLVSGKNNTRTVCLLECMHVPASTCSHTSINWASYFHQFHEEFSVYPDSERVCGEKEMFFELLLETMLLLNISKQKHSWNGLCCNFVSCFTNPIYLPFFFFPYRVIQLKHRNTTSSLSCLSTCLNSFSE